MAKEINLIYHETIKKLNEELIIANKKLVFQNEEKEKLVAKLQQLSQAVEQSPVSIVMTDLKGNIQYVNLKVVEVSGYSFNELIGNTPRVLKSGHTTPKEYKQLWETIVKGEEWQGEFLNKKKNGELYWESATISSIKNAQGEITHFLAVMEDITERKLQEDKLIENSFFLRESQRIAKIGSYRLNVSTGYWQSSEVLDSIFGIDANYQKDIPGWLNLIHPDDKQQMYKYLTVEVIGKQQPFNNSCRIVSINDKQIKWAQGIGELIFDAAGKPTELIGTIQDITERKIAEEALMESERNFRIFSNDSLLPIYFLDTDTKKIIYANPSFMNLLGYTAQEVASLTILDFVNCTKEEVEEVFEKVKREKQVYVGEREWICKDGRLLNMLVSISFISHNKKNINYVSAQDITERKKIEKALLRNEASLKQAQAIAHLGSWEADFETNTVTFSEEACRIYGFLPEENKQSLASWMAMVHPKDLDHLKKEIEKANATLAETTMNHRIICKDGTVKYIYAVVRFMFNPNGMPIGIYGIVHDITERRKAEKALKISEKDLIKGEQIAKFGYWRLKLDENKIYFSKGARTIFGTDEEVQTLEEVKSFRLPEYNDLMDDALRALIKENKPYNVEYKIKRKSDGEIIDVHSIAEYSPKIQVVFGTIQDVTERKKTHDALVKAENQVRSFATRLTHSMEEERKRIALEIHDELGQQLTAFKMGVDWVLHKQTNTEGEVATKLNELLKMSDDAVTSIRRISADLRPAIIDDLGLVAALEGLCNDLNKRGEITCHFFSNVEERKFEDTFSINTYRIAQESLTNVVRHAQANSVIVSLSESATAFILEITDDGKGISEEDILKSKHLGIAGMKERAALLGGEFIIEGTKNKGTCTTLILPLEN